MDEMMTSSSHGERQNVISPPPDMRELVNDITKSLDTPTDDLDHPLSPGKGSFISEPRWVHRKYGLMFTLGRFVFAKCK